MKPEVKIAWVDALCSGEYVQGRHSLNRNNHYFCCLGVLCEVAHKRGVVSKICEKSYIYMGKCGEMVYLYGNDSIGETSLLPKEVVEWAELESQNPKIGHMTAIELNDSLAVSFEKIAALITKHL